MKPSRRFSSHAGMGTIEYITILALVLGLFLFVFWTGIAGQLESKLNEAGIQVKIPGKKKISAPRGAKGLGESPSDSSGGSVLGGSGGISYAPQPVGSSDTLKAN